jgi:hypothetical protein
MTNQHDDSTMMNQHDGSKSSGMNYHYTSDEVPTLLGDVSECPRCHKSHSARFYGPCEECRAELRATMSNEARTVDVAEYEPKMNVTLNAVALKED